MPKVRIVTDSAADMTKAEADRLGIIVVPLIVTFGTESCLDGELDTETFWRKAHVVHPQTSQPPVGAFDKAFAPLVDEGAEVICIAITSKHSGTFNSAWTAAQRFAGKVAVFDSWALSWGESFLAQAAAEAASEGKTMSEILTLLGDARDRLHTFILLDTIEFLKKGGRAAKFIAVVEKVARFFNIKLLLTMKEGELKLLGTANSFSRGLLRMEREVLSLVPLERLAVMHIRNPETADRFARSLAAKLTPPLSQVPSLETGAALSCHGGPGVVAAVALTKRGA